MFYTRLMNISEGTSVIQDLKLFNLSNDVILKLHSMTDGQGVLENTHCLNTIDLGNGFKWDMRT